MATFKITCDIVDCQYLKITDTTVYSIGDPASDYGRAYFATCEGDPVERFDLNNIRSLECFLETIKDGLHLATMAVAPAYVGGATYQAGSVVWAVPGPPIDKYYNEPPAFYKALVTTSENITTDNLVDWVKLANEYESLHWFEDDPLCWTTSTEQIVDCVIFSIKRTGCRLFEMTKSSLTAFNAEIYTLKSYISGESTYEFAPNWVNNKAVFNFNTIAPEDLSNIYIVKLVNPDNSSDINYTVVYDLCKALECQTSLLLSLFCSSCEGCTVSKEELYKRFTLNRMMALMSEIMLNIHQADFVNIGATVITDDLYTSIKSASEKLELYLNLVLKCGECTDTFENCADC